MAAENTRSDRAQPAEREPLPVAVVIGSTRQGRLGPTVAAWFVRQVNQRRDMKVDVIDLAAAKLPTTLPMEADAAIQAFTGRIAGTDAVVVVTPEYNHGYPASLKLAIDYPRTEWQAKPVAFVSYGGMAGGLRAVEQLRQVFAELHTVTIRDTVSFHTVYDKFDDHGELIDPDGHAAAAKVLLDQLAWWAEALREARSTRPYVT